MSEKHTEAFKERARDWKPNEEATAPGPRTVEGIMKVTQNLPREVPSTWKLSDKGREAVNIASSLATTTHGLAANVPIACGGDKCPYKATCMLYDMGMAPVGERCAMEIATVMNLYTQYCEELQIDATSIVNLGLIKDLVDCHIMIQRADALIAASGKIIEDVAIGISEEGEVVERPEISKALDVKEKYLNLKNKILNQLMATPKDKASVGNGNMMDASKYAAELMKKAAAMRQQQEVQTRKEEA